MDTRLQNQKRLRLFLAALTVSLCFGAFAIFAIKQVENVLLEEDIQKLNSIADNQVSFINILIESYQDKVRLVTTRTRLRLLLDDHNREYDANRSASMNKILKDAINNDPDIDLLVLYDLDMNIVTSTNLDFMAFNTIERHAQLGPKPSNVNQSMLNSFELDDYVYLSISAPIKRDGRVIGLLQARIKPLAIRRNIQSIDIGETGEVVLAQRERDGNVIFVVGPRHSPVAMAYKLASADQIRVPMVHAFIQEKAILFENSIDYKATPVVAVTRRFDNPDWGLVVKIDRVEVFETIDKIRLTSISAASVLVLITILMTFLYGKKIEESLRKQKMALFRRQQADARFLEIFDNASDMMMIVNQNGLIARANIKCEQFFGYSISELIDMPVENLIPEKLRKHHKELRTGYLDDQTIRNMNHRPGLLALTSCGETVSVAIDLRPIELADGNSVMLTLYDNSKELEAKKQSEEHTAELSRSNQNLDQFAAIASHDLKAPLRNIMHLASFIREDSFDRLSEESQSDLTLLSDRALRMEKMLDDLLQYSRIGQVEGNPVPVNLQSLITEVAGLYLAEGNFKLNMVGIMPTILAPPTALEIVFRNLFMNSVKHHDQTSGEITVTAETLNNTFTAIVCDDGPGIPPEHADKVFELFQTLKSRDKTEGSGMGLALVKKTMQTLGGSVSLVQSAERGACFKLEWPATIIVDPSS